MKAISKLDDDEDFDDQDDCQEANMTESTKICEENPIMVGINVPLALPVSF